MKRLILILCATALCAGATAQGVIVGSNSSNARNFYGTQFSGRIVDSLTREALPSAVISVVSKSDLHTSVRNYVTDAKGYFEFKCDGADQYRMEVSVLGYKPHAIYLTIDDERRNLGDIPLSQSSEKIDEVVVRARIQMYNMKGDTVVYIPRSVNTMKDDKVSEILRHMPGVEVDQNGSVTILGQQVERTYVNQKLLFGDDPTVAIQQLEAKEVASIESYDEVDEDDAVKHGKNARKRKVLNIVTFKEFSQSLSANAVAEAGAGYSANADGSRPARYRGEGDAGYYSEKLQIALGGQSNNLSKLSGSINNDPYMTHRASDANASVSGRSGRHKYSGSYGYNSYLKESIQNSQTDYFPSEFFESQQIIDTTQSTERSNHHNISAGYNYNSGMSYVNSTLNAGISDNSSINRYLTQTRRNGMPFSASDRDERDYGDNNSVKWDINTSQPISKRSTISFNGSLDIFDNTSDGMRIDKQTIDGVTSHVEQELFSPSPLNRFRGNMAYSLSIGEAGRISFGVSGEHEAETMRKIYTDIATGQEDVARSEDAHEQLTTWGANIGYMLRRNNSHISVGIDYNNENRSYKDRIRDVDDKRQFHFVSGSLAYNYTKSKKNVRISLGSANNPINSRDLSLRIRDSNPLFINVGNPSLKPMTKYNFSSSLDMMHGQASWNFDARVDMNVNPTIRRSTYYAEATRLPEYDNYLIPAGATLTTVENGESEISVNATIGYKTRINPLKCLLTIDGMYMYTNPQKIQYGVSGRNQIHRSRITVGLTTNFSPIFRITLRSATDFNWYKGFGVSNNDINERLGTKVQWDIFSSLCYTADYTMILRSSSANIATPASHMLNMSLGYRILKQRGKILFTAYDILNKYSDFRFSQGSLSATSKWTHINSTYFTFSFEYKINNRR